MVKLFFIASLMILTSCATTCDGLKLEKEKKRCYDDVKRHQETIWMDREFNRR